MVKKELNNLQSPQVVEGGEGIKNPLTHDLESHCRAPAREQMTGQSRFGPKKFQAATLAELRSRAMDLLEYNPATGDFRWKKRRNHMAPAGSIAGAAHDEGYRKITIDGQSYFAHRLAWFVMHGRWPTADIDHINGIRDDNRLANLREATRSQNNQNGRRRSDNTSGYKGVSWHNQCEKWCAEIHVNRRKRFLGLFPTPEEAHAAYAAAAQEMFGAYGRIA